MKLFISGKLYRIVGNAAERFEEDALRILRAFRFSAQLDFAIEETTRREAAIHAGDLKKISAERIRQYMFAYIVLMICITLRSLKHPIKFRQHYRRNPTLKSR